MKFNNDSAIVSKTVRSKCLLNRRRTKIITTATVSDSTVKYQQRMPLHKVGFELIFNNYSSIVSKAMPATLMLE